jgi:hypothetical protein
MMGLQQRKAFFNDNQGPAESAVIAGDINIIRLLRNADELIYEAFPPEHLEPRHELFRVPDNPHRQPIHKHYPIKFALPMQF